LAPDETVFLSPYPADQPVIQLHSGRHLTIRGYNGRYCLPYPAGDATAPTTYIIVPGFEDRSLEQLLADFPEGELQSGPLRASSDRPYFNAFQIRPGERPASRPKYTAGVNWNDTIALSGYDLEATTLRPGDTLTLTLYYEALGEMQNYYTAFVHLLGAPNPETGSPLWSQSDSEPCQGGLPTSNWQVGETIRDTITLFIPLDAPSGEYQLVTGFYTWPDLTRLPIFSTDRPTADQSAILQTIHIE
jgi:hypothetical protein